MSAQPVRTTEPTWKEPGDVPPVSARDAAAVVGDVLLPMLADGVVERRPRARRTAGRTDRGRRGIERVRELRERYGPGPLRFSARGRTYALVLEPEDAHRVLSATPETFVPDAGEGRGALARFQPHGAIVLASGSRGSDSSEGPGGASSSGSSEGRQRAARRRFVEEVLDTPQPVHHTAERLTRTVREEAGRLLREAGQSGLLTWDEFHAAWWRTVRRLVLGDAARDDRELTEQLQQLLSAPNWSLPGPRRRALRAAFLRRVRNHVHEAERSAGDRAAGSLAALVAATPSDPGTDQAGQIARWLSAYEAAGVATVRALALLATHPAQAATARAEAAGSTLEGPRELPYLRGCALESVRLWPTVPLLLRRSAEETVWRNGTFPAGTVFVLHTPYLHRGGPAEPYGDTFTPGLWTGASQWAACANPALLPFGSGPAGCPGANLALLTVSTLLATLLEAHTFSLASHPVLRPPAPVPAALDHFGLRFRVHREEG